MFLQAYAVLKNGGRLFGSMGDAPLRVQTAAVPHRGGQCSDTVPVQHDLLIPKAAAMPRAISSRVSNKKAIPDPGCTALLEVSASVSAVDS